MEINDISIFLDYFNKIHKRSLAVMKTIPTESYNKKLSPTSLSLAELIIHIANINLEMYGQTLRGNISKYSGFSSENISDPIQHYIKSYDEIVSIISSFDNNDLQKKINTPANLPITCWKWMRAMIEHEIHHRGQIYSTLNYLNIKTPPLYGLTSEEVVERSH